MRIENEDQNVTLDTLEQLCKVFHVDVGDLFPARLGTRVYPPSPRTSAVPASAMLHDSAGQKGKRGKPGK